MNYQLIYADPPWSYRDKANDGERGASHKYSVMNVKDICRLPVWDLADADSCLLAMWWVPTQPIEALKVMEAWGFRLMTMKGFTWHKTNRIKGNSAIGMGHMTRANSEDCLFAVRGKMPTRIDASICQHLTAPRMEHSAKPPEVREKLVQLLGDVPRIELFSRGDEQGWHHWGNECPRSDIEMVGAQFQQLSQPQAIQEIIHETNNTVWPVEVHDLFNQVAESSSLDAHLQNKLRHHINRLKMDGLPTAAIIQTAGTLARAMGARA